MKKIYGKCVTDRFYEGVITVNKIYELIPHALDCGVYILCEDGVMRGILKDRFIIIEDIKLLNIKIV